MYKLGKQILLLSVFSTNSIAAFASAGYSIPLQVGFYATPNATNQYINIDGLVGNRYLAKKNNSIDALFGVGYFINSNIHETLQLSYGINGFYFAKQSLKGKIAQEDLFENLSYSYRNSNIPIYLASKAIYKKSEKYDLTFDLGIGPNFMRLSHYHERPLNDYTLPDNAFSSNTNITFSATAGIGLRVNNLISAMPLECGYRFFYLGQGHFKTNNEQVINQLKNKTAYANALVCSVAI